MKHLGTFKNFINENKSLKSYWILKHGNSGAPITILQIEKFDKDLLQKTFDMECWKLEDGESLEYGKSDAKYLYPSMLDVEKENGQLRKLSLKGYYKYNPKYNKDGDYINNNMNENKKFDRDTLFKIGGQTPLEFEDNPGFVSFKTLSTSGARSAVKKLIDSGYDAKVTMGKYIKVEKEKANESWKDSLQNVYNSFEEWESYDDLYDLSRKLGYESAREAWDDNPIISGSTDPSDYKKSPVTFPIKKSRGLNL